MNAETARGEIEFHDSTVAEIVEQGGSVVIRLAPVVFYPREDPKACWTQDAVITVAGGRIRATNEPPPSLPRWLFDADLELDGRLDPNLIPAPMRHAGPTSLTMTFDDSSVVAVDGEGIRIELVGSPEYLDPGPGRAG